MIALRGQPAGFRAPMLFSYSCCVVSGSGPAYLGPAMNYPAMTNRTHCFGIGNLYSFQADLSLQ